MPENFTKFLKMRDLDDPYIEGNMDTRARKEKCEVCHAMAFPVIHLHNLTLPDGIKWDSVILTQGTGEDSFLVRTVGINCGCYARFHRQVAHIVVAMTAGWVDD